MDAFRAVLELQRLLGDQNLIARLLGLSAQEVAELVFAPPVDTVKPDHRARAEYLVALLARHDLPGPGNYARFWLDKAHPELSDAGSRDFVAPLDVMGPGWLPSEAPLRLLWQAEVGEPMPAHWLAARADEAPEAEKRVGVMRASRPE